MDPDLRRGDDKAPPHRHTGFGPHKNLKIFVGDTRPLSIALFPGVFNKNVKKSRQLF